MPDSEDATDSFADQNVASRPDLKLARSITDLLSPAWMGHILLLLSLVFCLYNSSLWWHADAMDDAYITFRHSKNLVDGHGPVYNPGERVEGYTTPVWMILMAGVIALGGDPVFWSKIIGICCGLGLLFVLYKSLLRIGVLPGGAGLATLMLAGCPTLNAYTTSGMETCLYALLFFLALERLLRPDRSHRNLFLCSLLFILSALTHPEALALWGLAGLYIFFAHIREDWKKVACFALPGLLSVAHFAWRFSYYGDLFPNTFYVWTGGGLGAISYGVRYVEWFIRNPSHALWIALACYGASRAFKAEPRAVIIVGCTVVFHVLYIIKIGGDHMSAFRTCLIFLAPLAYLSGLLLRPAGTDSTSRDTLPGAWVPILVILFFVVHTQPKYLKPYIDFFSYYEGNTKLGHYLAKNADPDTVVAVMAAGAIPYYSGLKTIDMLGLNDPFIARLPFPDIMKAGMNKWDLPYVLALKPEIIVVNSGYFRSGDPAGYRAAANVSGLVVNYVDIDCFEKMQKNRDYEYRPILFEDGSRFYIFERRGKDWEVGVMKDRDRL
jgi:hypothetical protein